MASSKHALLKDLFIVPDFDNARVEVTFTAPRGMGGGAWRIAAGRKTVASGRIRTRRGKVAFGAKMPGFTPWTIAQPFLYRLVLDLKVDGDPTRIATNFGMRKFHAADNQLFLNNRPFYVRGVIRGREAHDHPNLAGLSEQEFYAKFIRAAKKLGFNFIRFHSKVPPDAYFDAADRLGILTHVEVRKYYGKYQKERELMDHDPVLVKKKDWVEAILRIRNRASLMVYCLGNEINKPGRNPQVADRAAELRKLDTTRLFIDTCARGEFDRGLVDLDVQHMGYFAPFGRNYAMFDTTANWAIFGSVDGKDMVTGSPEATTRREVPLNFPVIAHEVGHYVVLRDLEALKKKFARHKAPEPWWIDELIKLRKQKRLVGDYARCMEAGIRFQQLWYKQVFESIRKSPVLVGFNFLQLADTERYENANGLLDCFDDVKPGVDVANWQTFNSDAVVVADLPRRTFFESESLTIPVWLSNCTQHLAGEGTLTWRLTAKTGKAVDLAGKLTRVPIGPGRSRIATLEAALPESAKPVPMELAVSLKPTRGEAIKNRWNLWLYPNRPETLAVSEATVSLGDVQLNRRYPRLAVSRDLKKPRKLLITDRFTDPVFAHLARGGDVLMLYRIPETRDRSACRERFYMPSTWDRFKAVIWERGHNLGGFLRPHAATRGFPTDGFLDFQFAGIIDDCEKFSLDDFPVRVTPIVQGVDKASRDRFDVYTFGLRELQADWTMRRFAYLFDLRVGKGRLMMCGFNLTGLGQDTPEACAMFESLAACVTDPKWKPRASISADDLKAYLAAKGKQPRIKERMMTQYWQLDDAPLETAQYWKDAEAWIRKR